MRIPELGEFESIRAGEVPRHIGAIMDGNGRWAQFRASERTEGHAAAEYAVVSVVDAALELGVEWLTVYAFSTENWKRADAEGEWRLGAGEVGFLMNFQEWLLRESRRTEFIEKGVRIRFLGRNEWVDPDGNRYDVPDSSLRWMEETEALSGHNSRLQFCIAFNYGGRAEIVDAVKRVVKAGVAPEDVTEELIGENLYLPEMPDLDLVIRTSAEERLSNFFPWQAIYAEFVFTDTLWPDFRGGHLYGAVAEYQARRRRKGATSTREA